MDNRIQWQTERWLESVCSSPPVRLYLYLYIYLSIYPSIYLSIDLSICSSVLSVCLSVCLLSFCASKANSLASDLLQRTLGIGKSSSQRCVGLLPLNHLQVSLCISSLWHRFADFAGLPSAMKTLFNTFGQGASFSVKVCFFQFFGNFPSSMKRRRSPKSRHSLAWHPNRGFSWRATLCHEFGTGIVRIRISICLTDAVSVEPTKPLSSSSLDKIEKN